MTSGEKTLWALLRKKVLGLHFRRQHPVGPYILDFYCAEARLCIEVDGPVHAERSDNDQRRTEWLAKECISVLRFSTSEVETRPAVVLATIAQAAPPSPA
jgi:very-short-patch-repair endonuclease